MWKPSLGSSGWASAKLGSASGFSWLWTGAAATLGCHHVGRLSRSIVFLLNWRLIWASSWKMCGADGRDGRGQLRTADRRCSCGGRLSRSIGCLSKMCGGHGRGQLRTADRRCRGCGGRLSRLEWGLVWVRSGKTCGRHNDSFLETVRWSGGSWDGGNRCWPLAAVSRVAVCQRTIAILLIVWGNEFPLLFAWLLILLMSVLPFTCFSKGCSRCRHHCRRHGGVWQGIVWEDQWAGGRVVVNSQWHRGVGGNWIQGASLLFLRS